MMALYVYLAIALVTFIVAFIRLNFSVAQGTSTSAAAMCECIVRFHRRALLACCYSVLLLGAPMNHNRRGNAWLIAVWRRRVSPDWSDPEYRSWLSLLHGMGGDSALATYRFQTPRKCSYQAVGRRLPSMSEAMVNGKAGSSSYCTITSVGDSVGDGYAVGLDGNTCKFTVCKYDHDGLKTSNCPIYPLGGAEHN